MNNTNNPQNNEKLNQQPTETTPVRQNLASRSARPVSAQTQGTPRPTTATPQVRRPLNNEDRRRMEAARQAAIRTQTSTDATATPAATPRPRPATAAPATAPRPRPTTATPAATPRPRPTAATPATASQTRPATATPATAPRPRPTVATPATASQTRPTAAPAATSQTRPATATSAAAPRPRPATAPAAAPKPRPTPTTYVPDEVDFAEETVVATQVPRESSLRRKLTDEEEIFRDYQNNEPQRNNTTSKKRKKFRINWGIIIFVLLIAAVIFFSLRYLSNHPHDPNSDIPPLVNETDIIETDPIDTNENTNDTGADETDPPETDAPIIAPFGFSVTMSNENLDVGNQILVNYDHPYARVDTVTLTNVRANKNSDLQVSAMDDALAPDAFAALDRMTADLRATGCGDWLLLTSGYRNTVEQQQIWDNNMANNGEEYTRMYVATPGHSEHHTGLAVDLSFFTYAYASIPVADHDFGGWLWENCEDYGFILRYQADKTEITHTAYEAWHFRYVGIPHARAVNALNFCYEEYIDYIRGYTSSTKMLHIKSDGTLEDVNANDAVIVTEGWLVYYVPASDAETTEIHLPFVKEKIDYEISGNNADGFIVTVTIKTNA